MLVRGNKPEEEPWFVPPHVSRVTTLSPSAAVSSAFTRCQRKHVAFGGHPPYNRYSAATVPVLGVCVASSRPTSDTVIPTARAGLRLIELTEADLPAYYALVDRDREHLSRLGDHTELRDATVESATAEFRHPKSDSLRGGIWLHDTLIGRADLSLRAPSHYVLGYWLGENYTGQGNATVACQALIAYACAVLQATDIFAGVTKGNAPSEALLARLGFQPIVDRGTYTRFHLPLSGEPVRRSAPAAGRQATPSE